MKPKLTWNGNELVFDNAPNVGVAGIAPEMPGSFGEQLAAAYNAIGQIMELALPNDCGQCDSIVQHIMDSSFYEPKAGAKGEGE